MKRSRAFCTPILDGFRMGGNANSPATLNQSGPSAIRQAERRPGPQARDYSAAAATSVIGRARYLAYSFGTMCQKAPRPFSQSLRMRAAWRLPVSAT